MMYSLFYLSYMILQFKSNCLLFGFCFVTDAPPPTTRERPPGCRTAFVGGLPENVTEEIIGEAFANFGMIVSIRKGKKNFCHIRYELEESVDRSLFLSGYYKHLVTHLKVMYN